MNIDDGKISLARTGLEPLENELARPRNVEQCQVLRWRPDEDEVIVLGIIQREQRPALHAHRTVQEEEHTIELMDGQHFSNARVMIENEGARVRCWIKVAHPGFRAPHEVPIAEDYQRFLRANQEATPEEPISGGDRLGRNRLVAIS